MIPYPVNPTVILTATPIDTVTRTQPVNPLTPVPDATQSDTPAFTLGQKYMVQTREQLVSGHFMVNIAGKWLQMRMPTSVSPGDFLELTLIEQSPQLKFLLNNSVPGSKNPTMLSSIGKFIAQLLGPSAPTSSRIASHTAPLLPTPPTTNVMKAQLPEQLQQALTSSGLFYEAHLVQWLGNNRSLRQLRQEPQGRLPVHATATDSAPTSPIAPQTSSLVQQQLHTLETGTIQWYGEIWPGQTMEWDIDKYPREQGNEQIDDEMAEKSGCWQTCIHLQLPNLGKINARLMIGPQSMHIRLTADSDEISQQLEKEQAELINAMQTAGLTIHAMEIQQHEAS